MNALHCISQVPFDPLKVTIYGPGTDIAFVNIPTYFMVNTKGIAHSIFKHLDKDSALRAKGRVV